MHAATIRRLVHLLSVVWAVFLFPSILLTLLVFKGEASFASQGILAWLTALFPLVLVGSMLVSWILLHRGKLWAALIAALFPLLAVFVELVAADIALLL